MSILKRGWGHLALVFVTGERNLLWGILECSFFSFGLLKLISTWHIRKLVWQNRKPAKPNKNRAVLLLNPSYR